MIPDSNTLTVIAYQAILGSFNGDWIILFVITLAVLSVLLVFAKARASTAILSGVCVVFVFSLMDASLFFLFWVALIMVGVLFVNAMRKQFTGQ